MPPNPKPWEFIPYGQRLKTPARPSISAEAWEEQKDFIKDYFIDHNEPLWKVLERLSQRGIHQSEAQIRTAISRWGFKKNVSRSQSHTRTVVKPMTVDTTFCNLSTVLEHPNSAGNESIEPPGHKRRLATTEFESHNTIDDVHPTFKRSRIDAHAASIVLNHQKGFSSLSNEYDAPISDTEEIDNDEDLADFVGLSLAELDDPDAFRSLRNHITEGHDASQNAHQRVLRATGYKKPQVVQPSIDLTKDTAQALASENESADILQDKADMFFFAGMFDDAFDLYYLCYKAELAKLKDPDQLEEVSDGLILKFTDMALSAVRAHNQRRMSEECMEVPWSVILSRPPWSKNSTALFLLLRTHRFANPSMMQMSASSPPSVSDEGETWKSTQLSDFIENDLNTTRFASIYLSMSSHNRASYFSERLSYQNPDEIQVSALCQNVTRPDWQELADILGCFNRLLTLTVFSSWLREVSLPLWPPSRSDFLAFEHYVLYALLSKGYEFLATMDGGQFFQPVWALRAHVAFAKFKRLHGISPFCLMKEIAMACLRMAAEPYGQNLRPRWRLDTDHNTDHNTDNNTDHNLWSSAFLVRLSSMMSKMEDKLREVCDESKHELINGHHRQVLGSMMVKILSLSMVALEKDPRPPSPTPGIVAVFRLHVAYTDLCSNAEIQCIKTQNRHESINLTLLSDRSSQISDFSNFRLSDQTQSRLRRASPHLIGSPSANLSWSSLGRLSLERLFRTSSLFSRHSGSSLASIRKSASIVEVERAEENNAEHSQS